MKNIYYFFIGCFLISLTASCQGGNFLDATETTDLGEEIVFADSAYATQFLTDIYYAVGFSSNSSRFGNGGLDAASDEAEPGKSSSITTSLQFATGTVNPSIVSGDAWYTPYASIRKVNKLLQHLPNV